MALSAPVKPWLRREHFSEIAEESLREFRQHAENGGSHHDLLAPLKRLSIAGREALSPVVRLESGFHPWVAFAIMPLFALANAGVNVGGIDFGGVGATPAMIGVGLGLILGKPLGIFLVTWLMVRVNLCSLPRGVGWIGILVLGCVAGIGFTMSIFIAELAFPGSELLGAAKLAVLIATGVAATVGLGLGALLLPKQLDPDVANVTAEEAESSTTY